MAKILIYKIMRSTKKEEYSTLVDQLEYLFKEGGSVTIRRDDILFYEDKMITWGYSDDIQDFNKKIADALGITVNNLEDELMNNLFSNENNIVNTMRVFKWYAKNETKKMKDLYIQYDYQDKLDYIIYNNTLMIRLHKDLPQVKDYIEGMNMIFKNAWPSLDRYLEIIKNPKVSRTESQYRVFLDHLEKIMKYYRSDITSNTKKIISSIFEDGFKKFTFANILYGSKYQEYIRGANVYRSYNDYKNAINAYREILVHYRDIEEEYISRKVEINTLIHQNIVESAKILFETFYSNPDVSSLYKDIMIKFTFKNDGYLDGVYDMGLLIRSEKDIIESLNSYLFFLNPMKWGYLNYYIKSQFLKSIVDEDEVKSYIHNIIINDRSVSQIIVPEPKALQGLIDGFGDILDQLDLIKLFWATKLNHNSFWELTDIIVKNIIDSNSIPKVLIEKIIPYERVNFELYSLYNKMVLDESNAWSSAIKMYYFHDMAIFLFNLNRKNFSENDWENFIKLYEDTIQRVLEKEKLFENSYKILEEYKKINPNLDENKHTIVMFEKISNYGNFLLNRGKSEEEVDIIIEKIEEAKEEKVQETPKKLSKWHIILAIVLAILSLLIMLVLTWLMYVVIALIIESILSKVGRYGYIPWKTRIIMSIAGPFYLIPAIVREVRHRQSQ